MSLSELIRFTVESVDYDADYRVAEETRATTNFANFARDPLTRRRHIQTLLSLVNADLNRLLGTDKENGRYAIRLEVLTIRAHRRGQEEDDGICLTEVMRAHVLDQHTRHLLRGPTGLNFSSYLRDYDFRIVLPALLKRQASQQEIANFGSLHGALTRLQFGAEGVVPEPLAVAISISQNCEYVATSHDHPLLGREYLPTRESLTDRYFAHMGLRPQFFRPAGFPAPLAFYSADSLEIGNDVYLAALIAVSGNFQRIYRPEIYLSQRGFSEVVGALSRASLLNHDYEMPALVYDRQEREWLSDQQAQRIQSWLIEADADWLHSLTTLSEFGVPWNADSSQA